MFQSPTPFRRLPRPAPRTSSKGYPKKGLHRWLVCFLIAGVATLGASLERGRGLTVEDERSSLRVAVINRALATDFWPDSDPIGQCLRVGDMSRPCTGIVGIVENILLFDRVNTERSQLYLPVSHPDAGFRRPRALLIRTQADARPLVPIVQKALQSLTPDMPYVPVSTLEERTARQLQPWRAVVAAERIGLGLPVEMARRAGKTLEVVLGGLVILQRGRRHGRTVERRCSAAILPGAVPAPAISPSETSAACRFR